MGNSFGKPLFRSLLLAIVFCAAFVCAGAQPNSTIALHAADLKNGKSVSLDRFFWKYQAGDNREWAAQDFDDRSWKTLTNQQINEDLSVLENWNGRAWFRQEITVDEALAGQPLAWRMWHWGATEIYLDGELIKSYGAITPESDAEYNPKGAAFPVVFTSGGKHTIAIRYSFAAARDLSRSNWIVRGNSFPGFGLSIEPWANYAQRLEVQKSEDRLDYIVVGSFFAFALVHLLFYIFYRAERGNLFYSFFVTGLALSSLLQNLFSNGHFSAALALTVDIARLNVQSFAVISLLAFLYVEFLGRPSKFFWLLVALWTINFALGATQIWNRSSYVFILLLITFADCLRIMFRALKNKRSGAWIIAVGVIILTVGVVNNILYERKLLEIPVWLYRINLYVAIFSVPLMVSVYLARNFARTNRQLAAQLDHVRELSIQQLKQEREAAQLRLAHERTQAENERRAKELDEARQLQLSMLPKKLPQLPNLEIAAYMKPATEVGGDYYDFHVAEDGTLTVAVGDATGHGLKAGSVVTATKSLFNAFAGESRTSEILSRISHALKRMNLRGLFMAMALLKIKDYRITLSSAGMPAIIIYRNGTKTVEELLIKAIPLGSVRNYPYQEHQITLESGDCLVLMSDGFPEMFDPEGKMIGFEKAAQLLREIGDRSPQEIVDHYVKTGEEWSQERAPDDDVTFVVLKAF